LSVMVSPVWIKAEASDGQPALPRFQMKAYTGGPMQVGGWRHPVVVALDGLRIPSQRIPIRMGHDSTMGVGHTESVAIVDGELVARGVVSRDTETAREVVTSSRNGFPWQASIGAGVVDAELIEAGSVASVNGQDFDGPVTVIRQSVLGEISFVDLGADGNTSATVIASQTVPERNTDMQPEVVAKLVAGNEEHAALILSRLAAGDDEAAITAAIQSAVEAKRLADLEAGKAKVVELSAKVTELEAALAEANKKIEAAKSWRAAGAPDVGGAPEPTVDANVPTEWDKLTAAQRGEFMNDKGSYDWFVAHRDQIQTKN